MRNVCEERRKGAACQWFFLVLTGAVLWAPLFLQAQAPARQTRAHTGTLHQPATPSGAEQPKFKGIFEPVNFSQDLRLTDVFFVAPDVGYVSGFGGTIAKTVDGGKTWTTQLGGDPQSQEPEIKHLHFLDRTHGWAVQSGAPAQLLRTVDGENWEQVGPLPARWGLLGYEFVSPSAGILLDGNNNVSHIFRTVDGGRTWKEVFPPEACRVNAQVQGLNRQLDCTLWTLNMVSPTAGYILGRVGYEKPEILVVAKTTDGGASWSLATIQGPGAMFDYNGSQWMSAFFTDESNGVLATGGDRLYATNDGGLSWRGLPGTAPGPVQFADPEVGWSFNVGKLSFTTDGGKRWSSRQFTFPAWPQAFNLPRRDRAYVVGEHGMVYRYSVVPLTYQAAPNSLDAPAMAGFDSPLNGEVATLKTAVNDLATQMRNSLGIAATPPIPTSANAGSAPQTTGVGFQQSTQAQGQDTSQGGFQQSTANPPGQNVSPDGFPQAQGQGAGQSGFQAATVPSAAPDASQGGFQQDTGAPNTNAAFGPSGGFQQPAPLAAGPGQSMQQGGFQQTIGGPGGGVVASCCGQTLQKLEMAANIFATDLPRFSGKFRNLNLIVAGLQFINDVLQHTNAVKLAINNLRQARDKQSAAAALATLSTQVNGIPADVNGGFVQDVGSAFPPAPAGLGSLTTVGQEPNSAAQSTNQSNPQRQSASPTTNPVQQVEKAEEKLKDKVKKKIPKIPW